MVLVFILKIKNINQNDLTLLAKNVNPLCFDGIAPFARAVADADEVRHGVLGLGGTGNTGQTGIGKSAAEVFRIRAVGQFDRNLALDTITRTQLRNRTHLKNVFKFIATIHQRNVGAVLAAQITIAIRKRETDFNSIQFNAAASTLLNEILAYPHVTNDGLHGEFRRIGASTCQC
jgi:hypothetical protein